MEYISEVAARIKKKLAQKECYLSEISDRVRLWILRLLLPLGGHRKFISEHGFYDDILADNLGLEKENDFDQRTALLRLKNIYYEAEQSLRHAKLPKNLSKNIARLTGLVGLSSVDCRILEFTVLMHYDRILNSTTDYLGQLTTSKMCQVLSVLLAVPEKDVRESLSQKSVLACSGLVSVDRDGAGALEDKLKLLSSSFADAILSSDADPISLLRNIIEPSKSPRLNLGNFSHITSFITVLYPYLYHSITTRKPGVNIFIHGVPGTGKTEFARSLAQEVGCELFEVANVNEDDNSAHAFERVRAFSAAQRFLAQRRALILFDEVEDIFDNVERIVMGSRQPAINSKAWFNKMLEENPVPTLWLSNAVDCLDPAFIRRFDLVFEMPLPSKGQRECIAREASGDMLPPESIRRIAEAEQLAPAIITRAISVAQCIREELGEPNIPVTVEDMISRTMEAQGHKPLKRNDPNRLPATYDPNFIHVDTNLVAMADGLSKTKSGRLCLYGPTGTGKTAFGRWLADRLNIPLSVKKGSDLISMWVGGTEKNIAKAFHEAEKDGALLLIDEVDSFLQDRRKAQHSWEVTGVNEMLTQMESFSGIFITSTNLMEGLDQAALRRFDLKLKFDYLLPEQAWALFERQCAVLAVSAPTPNLKAMLGRLSNLTPGDFAAVARQNRFRPIETPHAFLAALEQECMVKEDRQPKVIGF